MREIEQKYVPCGSNKLISSLFKLGPKNEKKLNINIFTGWSVGETSKTFHQHVPQKYNSWAGVKEQNSIKSQSWENCSCINYLLSLMQGIDIEICPSSVVICFRTFSSALICVQIFVLLDCQYLEFLKLLD